MTFCGYYAREHSGVYYRQRMVNGIASSSVFHVGASMAYGGEILCHLSEDADLQDVSMDGSVIRAHACAAGAANSSAGNEALGRSKGGFGCKIHAICDALGMPVKFILTGGQEAECRQAIPLLKNVNASAVLADKAYDTNELREWLESRGIKAVIPPKSNRKEEIECDYRIST